MSDLFALGRAAPALSALTPGVQALAEITITLNSIYWLVTIQSSSAV